MGSGIKIGVAAWGDLNDYYPRGMRSSADRLRFYSTEFPLVEVDTSYYAIPAAHVPATWVENTPADFTFDIKAFRLFTTHQTPPRFLPPDVRADLPPELAGKRSLYYKDMPGRQKDDLWSMFGGMVDTLRDAGKLGVVLFQVPPWFVPRKDSYAHIDECRQRMAGYPIAVEFRNRHWLLDDGLEDTLSYLRRADISFVAVNEPQGFNSSVPPVADVTAEVGIVRFHGRNQQTWEKKGLKKSSERFDHYYSEAEMEEWAPRIATMKSDAREVHVIMNTNNQDQAIVNSRLAEKVLGEGLVQRPTLF
jgi:uncharacterized protein YecE (DUF72 family)